MMISAEVISHRNVRANMVKLNQPGQPRVVFLTEMSVFLGGQEIRAQYFGRGHTNGDAVIYFPALRVTHSGDLFLTNSPTPLPFMDFAQGGSAVEWTAMLDRMMTMHTSFSARSSLNTHMREHSLRQDLRVAPHRGPF